jgi:hypothetical protein
MKRTPKIIEREAALSEIKSIAAEILDCKLNNPLAYGKIQFLQIKLDKHIAKLNV